MGLLTLFRNKQCQKIDSKLSWELTSQGAKIITTANHESNTIITIDSEIRTPYGRPDFSKTQNVGKFIAPKFLEILNTSPKHNNDQQEQPLSENFLKWSYSKGNDVVHLSQSEKDRSSTYTISVTVPSELQSATIASFKFHDRKLLKKAPALLHALAQRLELPTPEIVNKQNQITEQDLISYIK